MIIKTKKYQLEPKTYTRLGMSNIIREQWWLPVALFFGFIVFNLLLNLVYENIWIYIFAPIAVGLYFLFWWVQFAGAAQLKQNELMFEKYTYEIDGRSIFMKVNAKEGMQLKWEMIQKAEKNEKKEYFLLTVSKGQFLYLPFKIFNSMNDIRFLESILRRKSLIKGGSIEKEIANAKS